MADDLIKHVPIVGQAYGFTMTALKIYNSTSPIGATSLAVKGILADCLPPEVKYPVKCGILLTQLIVACSAGGNPFSVALAIGTARQIIDSD